MRKEFTTAINAANECACRREPKRPRRRQSLLSLRQRSHHEPSPFLNLFRPQGWITRLRKRPLPYHSYQAVLRAPFPFPLPFPSTPPPLLQRQRRGMPASAVRSYGLAGSLRSSLPSWSKTSSGRMRPGAPSGTGSPTSSASPSQRSSFVFSNGPVRSETCRRHRIVFVPEEHLEPVGVYPASGPRTYQCSGSLYSPSSGQEVAWTRTSSRNSIH
jgi:hypothetical protein